MNNELTLDWSSLIASLDHEKKKYNQLRGVFSGKAMKAAYEFSEQYDANIKNLDELIEKAPTLANSYIIDAIDEALKIISSNGIKDVDQDLFVDNYYAPYNVWQESCDAIHEKFLAITRSAEEMNAYRVARREGRGKVIGGGFGLGGAVNGMAMASATNLAVGTAHVAFNLVAKGLNAVGDAVKKGKIFSDPQTKSFLVQGIYASVLNVHIGLLDVLTTRGKAESYRFVTKEEEEKAGRILNNIVAERVDDADKQKILHEVLALNPYSEKFYEFILKKYGDSNGKLQQVADFFHVEITLKKREIIEALIVTDTELNTKSSLLKVEDAGLKLNYHVGEQYVPQLQRKIQEFDLIARTFNGKVYSSRNEAALENNKFQKEKQEKIDSVVKAVKGGTISTFKWLGYGILASMVMIIFLINTKPASSGPNVDVLNLGVISQDSSSNGDLDSVVTVTPRKDQQGATVSNESMLTSLPFKESLKLNFSGTNAVGYSVYEDLMNTVFVTIAVDNKVVQLYNGKFVNPLPAGKGLTLLFDNKGVSLLKDGAIAKGCIKAERECVIRFDSAIIPKVLALPAALEASTVVSAAELPYVGVEKMKFFGPEGERYIVVIQENGHMFVKWESNSDFTMLYDGNFSNPLSFSNGFGLLFKDQKAYLLKDGEMAKGCLQPEQDCVISLGS